MPRLDRSPPQRRSVEDRLDEELANEIGLSLAGGRAVCDRCASEKPVRAFAQIGIADAHLPVCAARRVEFSAIATLGGDNGTSGDLLWQESRAVRGRERALGKLSEEERRDRVA